MERKAWKLIWVSILFTNPTIPFTTLVLKADLVNVSKREIVMFWGVTTIPFATLVLKVALVNGSKNLNSNVLRNYNYTFYDTSFNGIPN